MAAKKKIDPKEDLKDPSAIEGLDAIGAEDDAALTRIEIPPIRKAYAIISVMGDPTNSEGVVCHRFSEAALDKIEETQTQGPQVGGKKAKKPREARNPWHEFVDSCYVVTERDEKMIHAALIDPRTELPVEDDAEKKCLDVLYKLEHASPEERRRVLGQFTFGLPSSSFKNSAIRAASMVGIKMTQISGVFFVLGKRVPVNGTPELHRAPVKLNGTTGSIAYRAIIRNWSADIPIEYDQDLVSLSQLANLFNRAGYHVGVGEWRPEKKRGYPGTMGKFIVTKVAKVVRDTIAPIIEGEDDAGSVAEVK